RVLIPDRFSTEFILEGISLILNNNSFQFGSRHFSQRKGTCMGSKIGPVYAVLTLAYLEETKLYPGIREMYPPEQAGFLIESFKRYIDDCWCTFRQSFWDIQDFHALLNSLSPHLKFTKESDVHKLPFLDVLVIREGKKIITDLFSKPTDTKQYLHFRSCHPRHTKTNIPFSLARRICTIVQDNERRAFRLDEMKNNLLKRGYPLKLILNGISRAQSIDIQTLRTPKEKQQDLNNICFVHTHNPSNLNMHNVISRNIDFLKTDQRLNDMLKETKLINASRQPPSLKGMLTRARFEDSSNYTVSKCGKPRCKLCSYIITGSSFTFNTGYTFKVNASMNCDTKNAVYVIRCPGCNLTYIGETTNIRNRMNLHAHHIRDSTVGIQYVSRHLDTCGGGNFQFFPFYKMKDDSTTRRKVQEAYFISKFKSELNRYRAISHASASFISPGD
ncbi:MAG: GIY-YIG nuclease family protein, partial [Candidatus Omnitrophica bacterium]|nr:GIY-YIG nuclease family protein [Candidatus Omnitrophota bacterium]